MLFNALSSDLGGAASLASLSTKEALSGITGSISLVSWIVLLLPQLIENYKNGRADALSVVFLLAWFIGDLANLIGAIWGGLLPTVIAIGFYFCFADAVMLAQVFYYDRVAKREKKKDEQWKNNNPAQPLLPASRRSSVVERRRSHARRRDSLSAILVEEPTRSTLFIRNSLSIVGVCVAGVLGWGFAWWAGAWKGQENGSGDSNMPLGAQILGYLSTVLYLTARIPQIIRNHQKKSCEGLSLLFFCLSMLGNLTYGAGILFHSTEKSYVWVNIPWLAGSLGTMLEDVVIFIQFHMYANSTGAVEDEECHE